MHKVAEVIRSFHPKHQTKQKLQRLIKQTKQAAMGVNGQRHLPGAWRPELGSPAVEPGGLSSGSRAQTEDEGTNSVSSPLGSAHWHACTHP